MAQIEIPDEDLQWLRDFAAEINKQDNRCTGHPYYYCVRMEKRFVGADAGYTSDTVFVRQDGGDYEEYPDEGAALAQLAEEGMPEQEAAKYFDDHFTEFGVFLYEEDRNVFFTHKGFLEHMRLNAHNYPGKQDGEGGFVGSDKCRSYVQHAFRNPEIKRLLEIVRAIGDRA